MSDHSQHPPVVVISGRGRVRQHVRRVEDVKSLVFHGAHVEVIHSHYVVGVQVALQPEDLFVPAHGLLQGRHGVPELVNREGGSSSSRGERGGGGRALAEDAQLDFFARASGESVCKNNNNGIIT